MHVLQLCFLKFHKSFFNVSCSTFNNHLVIERILYKTKMSQTHEQYHQLRRRLPLRRNLTSSSMKEGGVADSKYSETPVRCHSSCTPKHLLQNPTDHMWTKHHEANLPSEDRHSSIVNLFLRPNRQASSLVRVSLWAVYDGHGGDSVSSYASEVLLPVAALSIANALDCEIDADAANWDVNGDVRGCLKLSKKLTELGSHTSSKHDAECSSNKQNQNPVHYKTPSADLVDDNEQEGTVTLNDPNYKASRAASCPGQHSQLEQHKIRNALTHSFLSVDKMWMNSIDSSKTQSCCVSGGSWNAGSCALVVCLIQRVECKCEVCLFADSSQSDRQECDAMLYTAHTGDCRAVLGTAGLVTRNLDSDKEDNESGEPSFDLEMKKKKKRRHANWKHNYSSKRQKLYGCGETSSSRNDNASFFRFQRVMMMPLLSGSIPYTINRSMWMPQPSLTPALVESDDLSSGDSSFDDDSETEAKSTKSLLLHGPLYGIDLSTDHSAHANAREADLVRERCNNAPRAIVCAKSETGMKRVAGSLAVTRALGDAYLKSPLLSFAPYKKHAPYITAKPEITIRRIEKRRSFLDDKILVLASDGIWERASGNGE